MGELNNKNYIEGVKLTNLKQIVDKRGAVFHIMRNDSDSFSKFGEAYISKVNSGITKGWKFHYKMIQNFTVVFGKMKIVLFDNRTESKTKGFINEFILDDLANYYRLTIPKNIWYSFKSLNTDFTLLLNIADLVHDSLESKNLELNNETVPYKWE